MHTSRPPSTIESLQAGLLEVERCDDWFPYKDDFIFVFMHHLVAVDTQDMLTYNQCLAHYSSSPTLNLHKMLSIFVSSGWPICIRVWNSATAFMFSSLMAQLWPDES